jgi:hypothetical protein
MSASCAAFATFESLAARYCKPMSKLEGRTPVRLAIAAVAAVLLIPVAGPVSAGGAVEIRAAEAVDFSAAKKKVKARKSRDKNVKKEQYMRAVPAK